jgi:hypothetical protein
MAVSVFWLLALRLLRGLPRQPLSFEALVGFLEFRFGLALRYLLLRRQRIESLSIGLIRNLLLGGPLWCDHLVSPSVRHNHVAIPQNPSQHRNKFWITKNGVGNAKRRVRRPRHATPAFGSAAAVNA